MTDGTQSARGINQNIQVDERVLHVQTEDLGGKLQEILTVVYSSGKVVFSCRNPYSYFHKKGFAHLNREGMVTMQHRGVVAGVRSGRIKATKGEEP